MTQGQNLRQKRREELTKKDSYMGDLFNKFKDSAFGEDTEIVGVFEKKSDVEAILSRGKFISADNVSSVKGEASGCHYNSAELFIEDQANRRIATGYALSKDNLWRCHSWIMEVSNEGEKVIETTEPREKYFGYILSLKESILFATNEVGYFRQTEISSLLEDEVEEEGIKHAL